MGLTVLMWHVVADSYMQILEVIGKCNIGSCIHRGGQGGNNRKQMLRVLFHLLVLSSICETGHCK